MHEKVNRERSNLNETQTDYLPLNSICKFYHTNPMDVRAHNELLCQNPDKEVEEIHGDNWNLWISSWNLWIAQEIWRFN